jgi:type III secretion protein L
MRAEPTSIDALPRGPGSRILRAADAEAWQRGISFCIRAQRHVTEVEDAARRAYDAERARGYADGKADGAREATTRIAETSIAIDRYLAGLEAHVARLAIGIVRRLLGEIDVADIVARLAAGAIADFRREKWLKIKVHPALVEQVRAAIGGLGRESGPALTVEADPRLATDACIVASEFAVVDAGVETQLAAIGAAFGIKQEGPRA